jgi:hypothetical protein
MARIPYDFTPFPRKLHPGWAGRSHASWGLCLKLWLLGDGQPIQVHGADWRASLCQQMGIGGRDRPTTRALMADLQSDGLMTVLGGFVHVKWHPNQGMPGTTELAPELVAEEYDRGSTGVQPGVGQESYPLDLSVDNHSGRFLQTDRQTEEREREHAREVVNFRKPLPDPPPDLPPAEPPLPERIVSAHAKRYTELRQGETCKRDFRAGADIARWCEANAVVHKTTPADLAQRVVAGLFASDRAAGRRWPLSWAAHDPAEFLPPPDGCKPVASTKEQAEAARQAAVASRAKAERDRFNAQIRAAKAKGDDYTADILAAKRDEVCARIQAQAS